MPPTAVRPGIAGPRLIPPAPDRAVAASARPARPSAPEARPGPAAPDRPSIARQTSAGLRQTQKAAAPSRYWADADPIEDEDCGLEADPLECDLNARVNALKQKYSLDALLDAIRAF
jgi:hypothetical protein